MRRLQKIFLCVSAISLLFLGSCGNGNSDGDSILKDAIVPTQETFTATTQENTASVPLVAMNALVSYTPETGMYVFNKNAAVSGLKPGSVVLFEGHSLRKITAVKTQGSTIEVQSEFAKLTDYYKDLDLSYTAPINWSDDNSMATTSAHAGMPIATMIHPVSGLLAPPSTNSRSVKLKTTVKGWKIEIKIEPDGDKMKLELVGKKGKVCSITAKGNISSFESTSEIRIVNGETQHFSYDNNGLNGEMEVKFAAVGLGSEIAMLEIPAKIEKTILVYGVIPVTLRLKANLKIFPEVAVGSSSQVSMKLKYNSDTGFSYDGSRLTPRGAITGETPEQTGDCNTATPAIAGMGVGVEFPRFEIGIFGNFVVPYLMVDTTYSTYLSTGLAGGAPPCHLARLKYKAKAGVSMNFLNVASVHNDYTIFDKVKKWTSEGSFCD
ncbi:hypothetical protein G5B37_14840 [Rasiella rasia]|uniref:Lipoprotein n=1 Tax=Rasiella rasia TaxID=2744027 RepID=A0A6G6GQA5_9FLAO|nr:hypothetical protein [Rasiella rasia]QIE60785.1 hypothetical protein G5B37_14840 [Rasiella rasia]